MQFESKNCIKITFNGRQIYHDEDPEGFLTGPGLSYTL